MTNETQIELIIIRFIIGLDFSEVNPDGHAIGMGPEIKRLFFIIENTYRAIVELLRLDDGLTLYEEPTQAE